MLNMDELYEIQQTVMGELVKVQDALQFEALLGCLVDTWAATMGLSPEQTFAILQDVAAVQHEVHDLCGAAHPHHAN